MNRSIAYSRNSSVAAEAGHARHFLAVIGTTIVDAVKARKARMDQRRALMVLDDRMLRDIGLSRADVEREYLKSSWQS